MPRCRPARRFIILVQGNRTSGTHAYGIRYGRCSPVTDRFASATKRVMRLLGAGSGALGLEACDDGLLAQRQCNLVPAAEEAFAEERVDVKGGRKLARCHAPIHQIDSDLYAWFLQSHIDHLADLGFRELDREQTAPEAVAFEDVAVRGRDDDPESRVQQ